MSDTCSTSLNVSSDIHSVFQEWVFSRLNDLVLELMSTVETLTD